MTGPTVYGAVAHCYRHPTRETGVRCVRCDRPICPDCMRPASVGFQCPDDVKLGQVEQRTPVGARVAANTPVISWSIIGLNVLVYVASVLGALGGINDPTGSRLFSDWQLFPYAIHTDHEYYRIVTAAFLHVSLIHIALNMFALWNIGPYLERYLGRSRFTALYLLSALGGGAAVYVFDSPLVAVAGASGAIFGLFAACLVLVQRLGLDPRSLIMIIALNFVFTFAISSISRLDHIGGFVIGGVASMAIAGWPKFRGRIDSRLQAGLLMSLLAVVVIAVAVRTATFPILTG